MNQLRRFNVYFIIVLLAVLSGCGDGYRVSRNIRFSSTQPNQIKVMTFNIRTQTIIDGPNHWNHRKQLVTDVIATNGADIVGLQEARNSQLKHINATLPEYATYEVGRSDGKKQGESCPILYRKDRFSMVKADTFWFSDTPSVAGSKDWGNLPPRICSWVHLVDKISGIGLYVYNLHLDHLSQNSRAKSIQLLTQEIARRETMDPFIVMGDFNMGLDNPAMQYLSRIGYENPLAKTSDAWQLIHQNRSIGTRHGFNGDISGPQIDHIRLSSNLQALDVRIDARQRNGRYPSDHFPVVAKLLLTSQGPLASKTDTVPYQPVSGEHTIIHSAAF
jgi:endonuclease/exonuclease/phosphatase family metal-dependent hydrolase